MIEQRVRCGVVGLKRCWAWYRNTTQRKEGLERRPDLQKMEARITLSSQLLGASNDAQDFLLDQLLEESFLLVNMSSMGTS